MVLGGGEGGGRGEEGRRGRVEVKVAVKVYSFDGGKEERREKGRTRRRKPSGGYILVECLMCIYSWPCSTTRREDSGPQCPRILM